MWDCLFFNCYLKKIYFFVCLCVFDLFLMFVGVSLHLFLFVRRLLVSLFCLLMFVRVFVVFVYFSLGALFLFAVVWYVLFLLCVCVCVRCLLV